MSRDTKITETVELLGNVGDNEAANQRMLARRIGVSIGLANALINRAVRKGLIKIKQAPARRYVYYLTPKGLAEKSRLVAEYLDFSLSFFRTARQEYNELFERCALGGRTRIVLCGAGELAEIATLGVNGVNGANVELVAVYDRVTNQGRVAGLSIVRDLTAFGADDVFVITDSRNAQEMYDHLLETQRPDRVLAPKFLRISPRQADSSASVPR